MVMICLVSEEVTDKAMEAIKRLNPEIAINNNHDGGNHFAIPRGISENDRQAWEDIIRGIIRVM